MLAESLRTIFDKLGKEPGGLQLKPGAPYAMALVDEEACTLCRACATVCPTHAFMYTEADNTLSFKHIECVACGLCAQSCPENAIVLRPELYLESSALEYQEMARDEMVAPVMVSISSGSPLPAPGLTGFSGVCGPAKNWSTQG